ncbi:MAG TPA: hypothetical protein VGQ09_09485, partial [Chitinophagaceae bacterium]|nr:hypothetical protein [Chitinophagaceae bacterium]
TAPTASDACNGATVSIVGTDVTGGTACARTVTRTWRATDGCGNQSGTVAQTITIVDTQAPTIGNAGANATIECTASPSFTAPTASDACNGATVSIVGSDVTGGTACARTITRTWRAVDGCGNSSATRSQTITIVDTQAPTIGNAGANATIECTATPSFTAPTASDACNGATVSIVGADVTGGTSCARTITRTWIAVDACGNSSATRSQTITIVDTQAPTIGNAGVNATIECTATPSFTAPTASDACDGATVSVVGADVTGGTTCARTITRTWRAVDVCGNSSATRSQTITIVDTQAPTIGNAGANATIECTATPSFTAPTASDACDGATVSIVGADVTGGTACARTITRTWRAVDNCGNNSATRSQTITIVDTQAPTIGNAGANATIECLATLVFTAPTASDACNGATVSIVGSDVTTAGANGTTLITRTWRAVDACGNSSVTRSQTITRLACIFCSYTQGFWGNKNGLAYMRDSGILATQIIIGSTAPGGKSILIPAGSWVKLNSVMPGGGPAGPLTVAGQCSILNSCFDAYLTKQGRINNVLLSQTIALSLNVRTTGGALNNLPIQSGCLQTSEDTFRLNENVVNYLTCNGATATVANLLALANNLLGGTLVPGQNVGGCVVPTYAEVNDAVTAINEGFDECRTFLGYGPCVAPLTTARTVASENSGDVTVSTSPNPYNDKIRFQIESRVSGQGTLEVYNMLGQKIQTVYQGFVQAGKGQIVYYYVPVLQRANLIYVFRVGNHRVTGKVLNIR